MEQYSRDYDSLFTSRSGNLSFEVGRDYAPIVDELLMLPVNAIPAGSGAKAVAQTAKSARVNGGALAKLAPQTAVRLAEGSPAWASTLVRQYANRVKPVEGFTDVFIHGTRDGKAFSVLHNGKEVVLNQRQIATWLQTQGVTGDIRLISCYSGSCPTGSVAQNLANKLGVKVRAPTDFIELHPNGMLTAPAGTVWRDLIPGVR